MIPNRPRDPLPDSLRALALLSVLVVNALGYAAAPWGPTLGQRSPADGDAAALVQGLVAALLYGKGYPILAFVFGMALWLAARLGWLFNLPLVVLIPLELLFLVGLAAQMARLLWAVRQKRNYPIVAVLSLLAIVDAVMLTGLAQGSDALQRQGVLAGLWLVAALMGLIGGRVIPFFTQRGLGRVEQVKAWPWLENVLLGGSMLNAILHAAGLALLPQPLVGVLFLAVGLGHLVRLVRWYDGGIWKVPLLWSLHLAMLWLVVAMLGLALWHFGLLATSSPALHALTVGAMGGLILAMIARVTLGHTGRALQLPAGMAAGFVLFNLGSLARVFLSTQWPLQGLWLAAVCWALAFAVYAWHYTPMLVSARVDGHPG